MRAVLEFNMDDPDDRQAHHRCVKATDMAIVLFEIECNLFRKYKHRDTGPTIEELREDISKLYNEHDINIDLLIS